MLRSSFKCKSTSHMQSIKRSPLSSECVSAESPAWDYFNHSQGLRRPGGPECICRRAIDQTARQIQERTSQLFFLVSQTSCLCPGYSFSLKCIYSLLRTCFLCLQSILSLSASSNYPLVHDLLLVTFRFCFHQLSD